MRSSKLFFTAVREALKHYTEAEWLGKHSVLATPYVLGTYLQRVEHAETAVGQGQALQQLLLDAAAAQWPGDLPQSRQALLAAVEQEQADMGNGGARFLFLVLDLRYFRYFFSPRTYPTGVSGMYGFLHISESAFYRYLTQAIEELTHALMKLIRPTLHLEQPLLNASLIGRDDILAACLADLHQERSVALSGMGGIGKTTLATAVSQSWTSEAVFWYTFRPGLNDDLPSLLFAIGHFLHNWGCNNFWLQIIVQEEPLHVQQALGFMQEDIKRPGTPPFLFCFDEVDLLHTERKQSRHGIHKQLLELLEALCAMTSVLLVGQRALIDTTAHYPLQPLKSQDIAAMFEQNGRSLAPPALDTVYRLTQGNPRLVELYLALLQDGMDIDEIAIRRAPAAKPLFHRLWKRLSQDEKMILAGLSVFRSYAPEDEWQNASGYQDLQRRQLLKQDAQGGIALLPLFRDLVYEELNPEQQSTFHHQAAVMRATRGQITAAAHHFVEAGDVETAVTIWFAEQDNELASGNAGAAYTVFTPLSLDGLPDITARQLKVIQNRLHLLNVEAEAVLSGMNDYSWHLDDDLSVDITQLNAQGLQQWGEAHLQMGNYIAAGSRFDEALSLLERLSTKIIHLHTNSRGRIWINQSNIQSAERESKIAQLEVERFQLQIKMMKGQFQKVQKQGKQTLALAQDIKDAHHIARFHYILAAAAANLGDIATANDHAEQLFHICERTGDRLLAENMRAELAGFCLNVGHFEEAVSQGEKALRFFERVKNEVRLQWIYSNLAEAYYETGQLDKAEKFAFKARNSENPAVQPYACYTLGLIHQAKRNPQAAEDVFQFGLQMAEQIEDRFIAAYLHRVYGSLLFAQNRQEEGTAQLQIALDLFTEMGIPHEIEKTKTELGN